MGTTESPEILQASLTQDGQTKVNANATASPSLQLLLPAIWQHCPTLVSRGSGLSLILYQL